jgi:hypothetical protein
VAFIPYDTMTEAELNMPTNMAACLDYLVRNAHQFQQYAAFHNKKMTYETALVSAVAMMQETLTESV